MFKYSVVDSLLCTTSPNVFDVPNCRKIVFCVLHGYLLISFPSASFSWLQTLYCQHSLTQFCICPFIKSRVSAETVSSILLTIISILCNGQLIVNKFPMDSWKQVIRLFYFQGLTFRVFWSEAPILDIGNILLLELWILCLLSRWFDRVGMGADLCEEVTWADLVALRVSGMGEEPMTWPSTHQTCGNRPKQKLHSLYNFRKPVIWNAFAYWVSK